jgi:hypothetical protein
VSIGRWFFIRERLYRDPEDRSNADWQRIHLVGASLLAMDVNDDAGCLNTRGVLAFFASELAPTGFGAGNKKPRGFRVGAFVYRQLSA